MSAPVTLPSSSGSSWNLSAKIAKDTQGLVTSGFGKLPAACALMLHAGEGGGWLAALAEVAPVTAADGRTTPSVALAFTSLGLARIGVSAEVLKDFSLPFVQGMMQKDRRRRLGDIDARDDKGAPLPTVEWGLRVEIEDIKAQAAEEQAVHAMLLVYHTSHDALKALVGQTIEPTLQAQHVSIVRRIALDLKVGDDADVREHFGFVDGISQPIPYGAGTDDGAGKRVTQDPIHGVRLGEILLGHEDAHETTSVGPVMVGTKADDGSFVPSAKTPAEAAVDAMRNPAGQQVADIGANGTYLVVRELRQEVDAFWDSMKTAADALNASDPKKPPVDATWVAERVIGRSKDGHMLRPKGPLPPLPPAKDEKVGLPDNDFLFFQKDRHGYGCPLGSHVRRSNPRDGLAYEPGVCADLLRSANAHRILRRGRKFGPDIGGPDDTHGKGLLFICLNGDIARQFEFVQQNWMLNPNFATLYDEVDPLVGPAGRMTVPAQPLRRQVKVDTFVKLVGGDYFFLPSLSTLKILAALPPSPSKAKA